MQRSIKCWTKLQGSSGGRKKFIMTSLHKSGKITCGLIPPCIYPCFKDWFLYWRNNPAFHHLWFDYTCHLNHLFTLTAGPYLNVYRNRTGHLNHIVSHLRTQEAPSNQLSILVLMTNHHFPSLPPVLSIVNPLNSYSSHGFYTQFRTYLGLTFYHSWLFCDDHFPHPSKIIMWYSIDI